MKYDQKRILVYFAVMFLIFSISAKGYSSPFEEVNEIMEAAIEDSAWPGGVLIVGRDGEILHEKAYGFHTYNKDTSTSVNDIFDLASITKVMATTPAVMSLFEKRNISLDNPVYEYLPEFKSKDIEMTLMKEMVTVRHLLTHTSGLPAYKNFDREKETPESIMDTILTTDLDTLPGAKYVYSCLGFITLGEMIKSVSDTPLDEYVFENIYKPLGLEYTRYNPPGEWVDRIVPTEYSEREEGYIRGRVHDGIAAGLAGVSGNAGLFSTGPDMAVYAQMMLNKGSYNDTQIFQPETVELFTKRANILLDNSRCLGWDSPMGKASAGVYAGRNSFGHTGYTGTSMWIDPDNNVYVILLTNAVHPHREYKYPNYFDWRQLVHAKVYEALELKDENPECEWRERWEDPKVRNQFKKTFWQKLFNR
jgi:beta-N-acetylhexosaminidase